MLKTVFKQNFGHRHGRNHRYIVRLLHDTIKGEEDGDLFPQKARIVICGSGLAGSR